MCYCILTYLVKAIGQWSFFLLLLVKTGKLYHFKGFFFFFAIGFYLAVFPYTEAYKNIRGCPLSILHMFIYKAKVATLDVTGLF